ncbi:MAG: MlaD family protein [Rhodocyclaceae bacterium]|nr:MlaD family protein [Rhodocyclaceae bacterium]
MENRAHALLAGLFTVALLLAAALAVWWLGGTRDQTHTYLLETRGSVTGLNLAAQVRYRGIRAGKVKDIRPDPLDPDTLLVEIALGRQYRLTDKSVAKLNYQGITGIAYVMLEEGPEGQGAGKPLDVESADPPRVKIQPGLVEKLGDKAGDIAGQMAELSVRLNRLLDERNLQNISRSLDNLAIASASLKELPRTMAALRSVLSDANLGRLNALLAHLEKTAGEAAPLTAEARSLVATMKTLAQRFDTLAITAGGVGERLNAETLPRAESLMRDVAAATRRLDRLLETLNDTPQAVLFGTAPAKPGPGEAGFVVPPATE